MLVALLCVIYNAAAAPQYNRRIYAAPSPPRLSYGAPAPPPTQECGPGLVRKVDGTCVTPIINKNVFLYNAPEMHASFGPKPVIPDPEINYNYVFIRAPSPIIGPEPIVVPPAQQKTLVYVLSEEPDVQQQEVIEVQSDVTKPEVFFIKYNKGENPTLPGGIDLQTALSQSAQLGQLIDGSEGSDGGNKPTSGAGVAPSTGYGAPPPLVPQPTAFNFEDLNSGAFLLNTPNVGLYA